MRLLITGINWPPETFLQRLIDGLTQAGVEVTVGCPTRPQGNIRWLRTPSWDASLPMRLARLGGMALQAGLRGYRDVKAFAPFVRQHRGFTERLPIWNRLLPHAGRRWNAIYFPWNSAAVAGLPVFQLESPVIVSCRGTQVSVAPHNPARQEFTASLRETFKRAAAVHCVSEATLRDACQLGLDPAKARVIRPAVDPELFRPAAARRADDGIFSVVTVGTLIWVKGHEWALRAIRKVADQGVKVRFDIIGDGPDRQRVLYTISDLGLENQVRWLGRLAPDRVRTCVQKADVFLLSSLSEGISNAVLEAMACGLPVVTTDCGGMREAVTDGVEGFVVPARDSEAAAAALFRLAAGPALRQRIGEQARTRIQREFSLRVQIQQWVEFLRGLGGCEGVREPLPQGAASCTPLAPIGLSD
jgi:colanic acid/amylovoran biosynthesis glycosyltransferase